MKYQSIYELNKVQQYIMQMRPILDKEALFSDGTKDYRIPPEPKENGTVTIRFRTALFAALQRRLRESRNRRINPFPAK